MAVMTINSSDFVPVPASADSRKCPARPIFVEFSAFPVGKFAWRLSRISSDGEMSVCRDMATRVTLSGESFR
jgi:hypothetical protein